VSIIFHQLVRNINGSIASVIGPPTGTPIPSQGLLLNEDGELWVSVADPIAFHQYGLPFTALSELCVEDAPAVRYDQAIGFTSNGRVAATNMAGVDHYDQGRGVNAIGGIIVTIALPPDMPGQVMNLVLTIPTDNEIHGAWDAVVVVPSVTSYTVEYKENTSGTWIPINVGLALTVDIPALLSGVLYDVRVYATNVSGDGPSSVIEQQIVEGLPEQVQNLVAVLGIESVSLTWTNPTAAPALIDINIEYKLNSSGIWINFPRDGLVASQVIYNLIAGGSLYDFRVGGENSKGDGAFSTVAMATPSQIAINLELELNELGITGLPVAVTNTGTGINRDFPNQVGAGAALTLQTHKGKSCWQNGANRALQTNGTQATIAQPATFFWAGIPFFLDGTNFRVIWTSPGGAPDASGRTGETTLFAGGPAVNGPPLDTTGTEWIVVWRLNGGSSSVRCIKNDGSTDSQVNGPTGGSNPSPFILGWDSSITANREFTAQFFDFTWYTGLLSASEETSKINALKQKWCDGVAGE